MLAYIMAALNVACDNGADLPWHSKRLCEVYWRGKVESRRG